jgi:uncharacterized protein with gpF-like domain
VRDSHAELEGAIMVIGEGIEPGQDYGCRCTAEPYSSTKEKAKEIQKYYGDWFKEWLNNRKKNNNNADGQSQPNHPYDISSEEWVDDIYGDEDYDPNVWTQDYDG